MRLPLGHFALSVIVVGLLGYASVQEVPRLVAEMHIPAGWPERILLIVAIASGLAGLSSHADHIRHHGRSLVSYPMRCAAAFYAMAFVVAVAVYYVPDAKLPYAVILGMNLSRRSRNQKGYSIGG